MDDLLLAAIIVGVCGTVVYIMALFGHGEGE